MQPAFQPDGTEKICNITDADPVKKSSEAYKVPGKNQAQNEHGGICHNLKVSEGKSKTAGKIAVHKAAWISSKASFNQKGKKKSQTKNSCNHYCKLEAKIVLYKMLF